MCVRKLPKARKEPSRRRDSHGVGVEVQEVWGTVPVLRSQPGKSQDSGDTGKSRQKDLASVWGIIGLSLGTVSDLLPNKSKKPKAETV